MRLRELSRGTVWWKSLRWRIIAWSFIPTAIILALVALVGFYAYQQVAEMLTINSSRELVRLSAGQLSAEMVDYGKLLTAAARTADFSDPSVTARRLALQKASNRLAIFDAGVLVLDNSGQVIATEPEQPAPGGQDWSKRTLFRQMVRSPGTVLGEIISPDPQGLSVVVVAVPITGAQGELTGTLAGMFRVGATSVSSFYGSIVKLRLGADATAYLVDSSGAVLYHTVSDRIGSDFSSQPAVQLVTSDKSGAFRTRDVTGRDIVAAYAPVPGTSWGLVLEQDWAKLLASGRTYGDLLLLLLALGVVIPAVVVTVGVRKITEPIAKLIAGSQEVASGHFGHMITVQTGDELEELSGQFNQMSAQLKDSYAAVQAREERLSLAMQGTNDGYWDWDLRTDTVYFSPRWKTMLGYQEHELENCYETWHHLIHPDDAERVMVELQAYLEGNLPVYELEHRLRCKDGLYRWILTRGVALRGADGKPYRIAGSHTDITERKQAEEALRASEAELRALLAAMTDVIMVLDKDGRYLKIAQTDASRLYRPASELLGRTLADVLPAPQAEVFLGNLRHALETRQAVNLEYSMLIGGRAVWFAATISPMLADKVLWVARDITESRQAEEALRESEERFRATFEQAAVGLSHVAPDGKWLWVNQKLCDIVGYTREELLNKNFRELTYPEDLAADLEFLDDLMAGKRQTYELEKRYIRKDGSIIWIQLNVSLLRDAAGNAKYIISVVEDITERKRAEEAIVQSEKRFSQVFHASPLPTTITTLRDGQYVDVNDAWLRLYGYRRDEVIGNTSLGLNLWVHPEERVPMIRQLQATGSVRDFEHQARIKSGEVRDVLVSAEVIELGGERYNLSLVYDITERKRAESQIRRQNEYLQALHQTALGVLGELKLTELLEKIVERAVNIIGDAYGCVYLVTPDKTALEMKVGTGLFQRHIGTFLARGEGLTGRIWETGEPLLVADYGRFAYRASEFAQDPIGSALGVPLRWGAQMVGVFGLARVTGAEPLRSEELELMGRFAQLASIALENASLHSSIQAELSERVRAQAALQERLSFERLVTNISTEFINLEPDRFDDGIDMALAAIGEFTGSDRSYVFKFSDDGARMTNTHEWCRTGVAPTKHLYRERPVETLPWILEQIRQLQVVHVPKVRELPPEASVDQQVCLSHPDPTISIIVVPMIYRGSVVGFLGFDSVRTEKTWTEDSISLLRMVGQVFVNAQQHKQAQQAVQWANQTLERRVEERTHELATLNAVAALVSRTLDLREVAGNALDKTMQVLGMGIGLACRLETRIDECGVASPYLTPLAARGVSDGLCERLSSIALQETMLEQAAGQPVVWQTADDSPAFSQALASEGVSIAVSVPLQVKGKLVGAIFLGTRGLRVIKPEELALLAAIGQQVGMAVENARLYMAEQERLEEAERRRRVAEGLREIFAVLNSQQSLDETLDYIVKQACQLIGSDAAALFQLQSEQALLAIQAASGLDADYVTSLALPLGKGGAGRALATRQPLPVPDVGLFVERLGQEPGADQDPEVISLKRLCDKGYLALLSVPLIVRDGDYGALSLYYRQPREFSQEEMRLAQTLADQAALAIESARLRDQAEQAAAIAERSRLARELHDSVTQSLYSVTLYAEAAARLLTAGNHTTAAEHLYDLRDTSQEALREMRLLIFQLRPPALEKSGLAAALQARLDGVEARGGIGTDLVVEGEEHLPRAVQEELYHLSQEALNNALKHARAHQVRVYLQFMEHATVLQVHDDGVGFDIESARQSGGLGLRGMEERVQRIGGKLLIESAPDQGTRVTIIVPTQKGQGGEK